MKTARIHGGRRDGRQQRQNLLLQGGVAGGRLCGEDVAGAAILRKQIQRQTHHNSTGKLLLLLTCLSGVTLMEVFILMEITAGGGGVLLGWGHFLLLSLLCGRVSLSPSRPGRAELLRNRGDTAAETGAARLTGVTEVKTKRTVMGQEWNTCRDKPSSLETDLEGAVICLETGNRRF